MTPSTYIISPDRGFITCFRCGKTSYNRQDIQQRYCGWCHVFHDELPEAERALQPAAERVHLVQCLCPQRHCIMAIAYEHGASDAPRAEAMLRETMTRMKVNPWCGICGLSNWHFEDRLTPFATMADAAPFLTLCQAMNLDAAKIYAELPKTN